MLVEVSTSPTSSVQLLFAPCPDCGVDVPGRTRHARRCDECRNVAKLARYRAAADVQRRKNGIPKVKGETFTCDCCGNSFVATSKSRAKYCEPCRPQVALIRARKSSFAKGEGEGRKRVGRTEICHHCGDEFVVSTRGHAKYCEKCKSLSVAGKLPHLMIAKREYAAERRKLPKHALNDLMRSGILKSITDKGGRSWQSLVDYTLEDLITHLERQFLPGMTWQNRGINGWHIDHRIPLSSFSFSSSCDDDFRAAWALTNLQPMWGDENIRKKDQIIYLI